MHKLTLLKSHSELDLNLDLGGQVERLTLKHPKTDKKIPVILPYNSSENFFHSGNFLMYPWVNRLESNKLTVLGKKLTIDPLEVDTKNRPIHGLYFNKKRRLIELKKDSARIEPIESTPYFPKFIESFVLEENSLTIRTEFFNASDNIQEFAYGYHPYLKLKSNLEDCHIQTNLTHYIPLTEDLLPNKNLVKSEISYLFTSNTQIGQMKLDHLFTGNVSEPYFAIADEKEKLLLKVRASEASQIPLPYFQVYIPEDRKSIAIEPMSSTGNAFFTANSDLCRLHAGERVFDEFVIELKGL
jgi:aldose 1-epimerase